MRHRLAGLWLLMGPVWGGAAPSSGLEPVQSGLDYHSFANIEQFRVTRFELDLRVDMSGKELDGVVGLQVKRLDPRATELILDTRDLNVLGVSEKAQGVLGATSKTETTWVSRPFHLQKKDPILGQALVIDLPPSHRPSEFIKIEYETAQTASALQWLTAEQTRHEPFLYSQSTPIGARSWIPLQDTPQVRMTYSVAVHTFSSALAVMSAKHDARPKRNGDYAFEMPEAVPPHLIALAVGDLAFKETGPRTGVYAQKSLLKAAVREFADTESMIAAGEKLLGPYRWERCDILVAPPSFPGGGAGNPRLTFVSPTVIAGDASQVSVVARELAHAWAGDSVTNATWRDRWLNDGFSAYLGSRMVSAVYGERRDTMERVLGLESLRTELAGLAPADQVLAVDLRDRDPAEAHVAVLREKGRLFLSHLDARFGRERFDAFLRAYFDQFALKSVTTEQFLDYLQANLLDRFPGIVTREQATAWITGPGIPPDAVLPTTDAFMAVDAVRAAWLAGGGAAKKLDTRDWAAQQWIYFLDHMPAALTRTQMTDLDQAFGFTHTPNAGIGRSWFLLAVRNQYQPAYARLEEYLETIGRRGLVAPLYARMMASPAGSAQAKRVFALARSGYHPQTVAAIDAIVNPPSEESESPDEQ